jgi:Holliday junction DNA helicase RuvA
MISAITGELREVEDDRVQLACAAVVYEILVPASDIAELGPRVGQQITLHTLLDIEGDPTRGGLTPRLIGFLRLDDKQFFRLFITVKGIGPKKALRALVEPIGNIAAAIESRDKRALMDLPEIGGRTAEQIIAELAGKVSAFAFTGAARPAAGSARSTEEQDAIAAAVSLGILLPDAERLLDRARQIDGKAKGTEALLADMLRLRSARG